MFEGDEESLSFSEIDDPQFDQFVQWLRDNGATFPKLRFVNFDYYGRGGLATETLENGICVTISFIFRRRDALCSFEITHQSKTCLGI